MTRIILLIALLIAVAGCTTSPTGREQLKFYSKDKMAQAGDQSYQQLLKKEPIDHGKADNRFVKCVVGALSRVTDDNWRVTVFKSKQVNAFAMPGGNIGVYSGILPVTQTGAQLAAVLGHEMGHVIAGHANERVSQHTAASAGVSILGAIIGSQTGGVGQNQLMALLGTGAQVGILLPFSRAQEAEADRIGLKLMAEAGFDPRQSVKLWRNMSAEAGGKQPPELLATHPSNAHRIDGLENHMNNAVALYQQAPRHPHCKHP